MVLEEDDGEAGPAEECEQAVELSAEEDPPDDHAVDTDVETVTGDSTQQDARENLLYLDKFGDAWLNEMERDNFHASLDESTSEESGHDAHIAPEVDGSNLR